MCFYSQILGGAAVADRVTTLQSLGAAAVLGATAAVADKSKPNIRLLELSDCPKPKRGCPALAFTSL